MRVSDLLAKFARFGVLHREEIKNDLVPLNRLIHLKYVKRVSKKGKVFYELTPKALSLLEGHRKKLLEEIKLRGVLSPQSQLYRALLEDLRFLDVKKKQAKEFLFLGDWQLKRSVVLGQLELSKYRYYSERGLV